jgi:hypothetical protein
VIYTVVQVANDDKRNEYRKRRTLAQQVRIRTRFPKFFVQIFDTQSVFMTTQSLSQIFAQPDCDGIGQLNCTVNETFSLCIAEWKHNCL